MQTRNVSEYMLVLALCLVFYRGDITKYLQLFNLLSPVVLLNSRKQTFSYHCAAVADSQKDEEGSCLPL